MLTCKCPLLKKLTSLKYLLNCKGYDYILAWPSNYNDWRVPSQLVTTAKPYCLNCEVCYT